MKAFLTPEERRSLSIVLSMIAAGYLLVGWRAWREPATPISMDSLDIAFIRLGAELGRADWPPGLGHDSSGVPTEAVAKAGPLDLNRADSLELLALPGIGPSKAAAILAWRTKQGGFRRAEDLLDVAGIGPATFKRLCEQVYVSVEPGVSKGQPVRRRGKVVDKQPDTK